MNNGYGRVRFGSVWLGKVKYGKEIMNNDYGKVGYSAVWYGRVW